MGQEEPLEWEEATHSSTLAWAIPWTVEPGRAMVHGVTRELDMTQQLNNNKWQPDYVPRTVPDTLNGFTHSICSMR